MEWLNQVVNFCLILFIIEIIVNWSYYKTKFIFEVNKKGDVYFKSDGHKKFHDLLNYLFAIVGVMVLIKWILF